LRSPEEKPPRSSFWITGEPGCKPPPSSGTRPYPLRPSWVVRVSTSHVKTKMGKKITLGLVFILAGIPIAWFLVSYFLEGGGAAESSKMSGIEVRDIEQKIDGVGIEKSPDGGAGVEERKQGVQFARIEVVDSIKKSKDPLHELQFYITKPVDNLGPVVPSQKAEILKTLNETIARIRNGSFRWHRQEAKVSESDWVDPQGRKDLSALEREVDDLRAQKLLEERIAEKLIVERDKCWVILGKRWMKLQRQFKGDSLYAWGGAVGYKRKFPNPIVIIPVPSNATNALVEVRRKLKEAIRSYWMKVCDLFNKRPFDTRKKLIEGFIENKRKSMHGVRGGNEMFGVFVRKHPVFRDLPRWVKAKKGSYTLEVAH